MDSEKKYLVSEYMRSKVVTLTKDSTLNDAVQVMIKNNTNGVVVVDEDYKVAGILSGWDIIEHIVPDYLEEDKHLAAFEPGSVFVERVHEVAHQPIVDFMSKQVHTVRAEQSLMTAATLLSEFKIRQLPVVDAEGKLVGYINRTDIKKAIGDVLGIESK